jgi:hypothetical protein
MSMSVSIKPLCSHFIYNLEISRLLHLWALLSSGELKDVFAQSIGGFMSAPRVRYVGSLAVLVTTSANLLTYSLATPTSARPTSYRHSCQTFQIHRLKLVRANMPSGSKRKASIRKPSGRKKGKTTSHGQCAHWFIFALCSAHVQFRCSQPFIDQFSGYWFL